MMAVRRAYCECMAGANAYRRCLRACPAGRWPPGRAVSPVTERLCGGAPCSGGAIGCLPVAAPSSSSAGDALARNGPRVGDTLPRLGAIAYRPASAASSPGLPLIAIASAASLPGLAPFLGGWQNPAAPLRILPPAPAFIEPVKNPLANIARRGLDRRSARSGATRAAADPGARARKRQAPYRRQGRWRLHPTPGRPTGSRGRGSGWGSCAERQRRTRSTIS